MLDHSIYEYGKLQANFDEYIRNLPNTSPADGEIYAAFGKFAQGFIGPQSAKKLGDRKKENSTEKGTRTTDREIYFDKLNEDYSKIFDPFLQQEKKTNNTERLNRGHLIYADFNGPGNEWKNLTPLTTFANKNHGKIERLLANYIRQSDNQSTKNSTSSYIIYYGVHASKRNLWNTRRVDNNDKRRKVTPEDDRGTYLKTIPASIMVTWKAFQLNKSETSTRFSDLAKNVQTIDNPPKWIGESLDIPIDYDHSTLNMSNYWQPDNQLEILQGLNVAYIGQIHPNRILEEHKGHLELIAGVSKKAQKTLKGLFRNNNPQPSSMQASSFVLHPQDYSLIGSPVLNSLLPLDINSSSESAFDNTTFSDPFQLMGELLESMSTSSSGQQTLSFNALNAKLRSLGVFGENDGFELEEDYTLFLNLHKPLAATQFEFSTSFGLDSLGLQLSGVATATSTLNINLGIDVLASGGPSLLPVTGKDNLFGIDNSINVQGLTGDLGFLKISANPIRDNAISASANIGLKLDSQGAIQPNITADLALNAHVELSSPLSDQLPRFSADITYGLSYSPITKTYTKGDLQLSNITIDMSKLVGAAKPMIDRARGVVNQFQPIIDFLTTPIPGLDKAGINTTLLDLAKSPFFSALTGRPPLNTAFLDAIPTLRGISNSLDLLQSTGAFNLGSVTIPAKDLAGINPRSQRFASIVADAYRNEPNNQSISAAIKTRLNQSLASLPTGTTSTFSRSAGLNGKAYFEFSLLEDPSSAISLMLGDPTVDLFRMGLPGLDLNFGGEIRSLLWPVPPVSGAFGGSFSAQIAPLHFGYDATGIQKLINGGSVADILDGFYIDTQRDQPPGLTFEASLYVKGQAGIPRIFEVGAEANANGELSLLLNDPNDDGRIRSLEIADNFNAGGIGNVFDINGSVTLGFSVFIEYLSFSFSRGFTTDRKDLLSLGPIKLVDFSIPGGRRVLPPALGRMEGTDLRLNVGAFAIDRNRNNEDTGEHFKLTNGLNVSAESIGDQGFANVQKVVADFGDGADNFDASAVGLAVVIGGALDDDTLIGGSAADSLSGGEGNDNLSGNAGIDTLDGGDGDDTVTGSAGADSLLGGDGNDTLSGGDENDSLDGGDGDDSLKGEQGDDSLDGKDGNDTLEGDDANDTLIGGQGEDTLSGGLGRDSLNGQQDADLLKGGEGDDSLYGDGADDLLQGDQGIDLLQGGDGDDTLQGGRDNDSLQGGAGQDLLQGDDLPDQVGNDTLRGDGGQDSLQGGAGGDVLDGGNGDDQVEGGEGNDSLTDSEDTLTGSGGNDTLQGGGGDDTIIGGLGYDVISGDDGADRLTAGGEGSEIQGGSDDDTISGAAGEDLLMGGSGEDTLTGLAGSDTIHGSSGNDLLRGDDTTLAATDGDDELNGDEGSDTLSGGGEDDYLDGGVGEDALHGDTGDDTLLGGDHNDSLWGGTGKDDLNGDAGEDVMMGEADNDSLSGGSGKDTLDGEEGDDSLDGGDEDDKLEGGVGNDILQGQSDQDTLSGSDGADSLGGGEGQDLLEGGLGNDSLDGGEGNDVLRGHASTDQANLATNDGNDILHGRSGKDELWGGDGKDTLEGGEDDDLLMGDDTDDPAAPTGKKADDQLKGGAGNDTLFGGLGNDILKANGDDTIQGRGFDRLEGGYGDDTLYGNNFSFTTDYNKDPSRGVVFVLAPGSGKDTIFNFQSNLNAEGEEVTDAISDVIQLTSGLSFGTLGIEEERHVTGEFAGSWVTSLIDLDTNQVLAELVDIRKVQIGRNNIDERNEPPDRLRLQSEKPLFAKDEEFRLLEGKVRDPNGSEDLASLQFWLKQAGGSWMDWHDLGVIGVVNSEVDHKTLTIAGQQRKFLLVSGDSVAEVAKSNGNTSEQLDQRFERLPVSRLYEQRGNSQWQEVFFGEPDAQGFLQILPASPTTAGRSPIPSIDKSSGLPANGLDTFASVYARFVDVNMDGFTDLARIGLLDGSVRLEVLRGSANGFQVGQSNPIEARSGAPVSWANLFEGNTNTELVIDGKIYTIHPATFQATVQSDPLELRHLPLPRGVASAHLTGMNHAGLAYGTAADDGLIWQAMTNATPLLLTKATPIDITSEAENTFWGISSNQIFIRNNSSTEDKKRGTPDDFVLTTPKIDWPNGLRPQSWLFNEIGGTGLSRRIAGRAEVANIKKAFVLTPKGLSPENGFTAAWLSGSPNNSTPEEPTLLTDNEWMAFASISEPNTPPLLRRPNGKGIRLSGLAPNTSGEIVDGLANGSMVLGSAVDRFNRRRAVLWERISNSNSYQLRDLGMLPGGGSVTPLFLNGAKRMLGSALDSEGKSRAVISWDGGLLDLNNLIDRTEGQPALTEAVGAIFTETTRMDVLVNADDGSIRRLTFSGLLRTDAQDVSRFTNGPGGNAELNYIARSGIGINGKPTTQILSLSPQRMNVLPAGLYGLAVADLDGMVDGVLRWFALEGSTADDLFAMGNADARNTDITDDGIIDDRDHITYGETDTAQRKVLKIYSNSGTSFDENLISQEKFSVDGGSGGKTISGSFEFLLQPDGAALSGLRYNITLGEDCAPIQSRLLRPSGENEAGSINRLTLANHGLQTGEQISFTAGSSPNPKTPGRLYWVRRINSNEISLHSNFSNAQKGARPITFNKNRVMPLTWRRHQAVRIGSGVNGILSDLIDQSSVTVNPQGNTNLNGILPAAQVSQILDINGLKLTVSDTIAQGETGVSGLSQGAVAIDDLDGDGDPDFVVSGFGNRSRRTANGAVVPVPEIHIYQTLVANQQPSDSTKGITILKEAPTNLPGLANGSIDLVDVNADGMPDLILSGEDFFVDDNPERFTAQTNVGGNPNTSIYLNRSRQEISAIDNVDDSANNLVIPNHDFSDFDEIKLSINSNGTMPNGLGTNTPYYVKKISSSRIQLFTDVELTQVVPIKSKGAGIITLHSKLLKFENAIFPANTNDNRWARFDYRFNTNGLSSGVYTLRAVPLDHARSDVLLEPIAGSIDLNNPQRGPLSGTATENLFVLANTEEDFYTTSEDPVIIEGFNPFLDRIQLRHGKVQTNLEERYTFYVQASEPPAKQLEIIRRSKQGTNTIAIIQGLDDERLIKFSNSFSDGNIVFADFTQSENPFILSPVAGQRRDASAQTGFIVTDHGDTAANKYTSANGFYTYFNTNELLNNYYLRLLGRLGVDLGQRIGALTGGAGNDSLTGGAEDRLNPAVTYLDGGDGNDLLTGGNRQGDTDLLLGGDGDDLLKGLAGRNLLFGQAGGDTLIGGLSSDTLLGGGGSDLLNGGGSDDTADYGQAAFGRLRINLTKVAQYQSASKQGKIMVEEDGDGNLDWIVSKSNYILATLATGEIDTASSTLRVPSHGLMDGSRITLRTLPGSRLPEGRPAGSSSITPLHGFYFIKSPSAQNSQGGNLKRNDFLELYQDPKLRKKIIITSRGEGNLDLIGDVSSIENIAGTGFDDQITGDQQRNRLFGGAGQDIIEGGMDQDWLDGGSGNDSLSGGEGSDTLIGGGGQDTLVGGAGDDLYVIGSNLLTLEEAFEALGGRLSDLSPIPPLERDPARTKPITYEQFVLLADANRWESMDGKPQFGRFRELGLGPDPMLFERAKLNPKQGWLRVLPGGSIIDAGQIAYTGNDLAYLELDQEISLQGLQAGQIGLAQSGTNLVIDINRDGIAEDGIQRQMNNKPSGSDVTITNFFKSNGTEAGENDISLRVRGLQATYFDATFVEPNSSPFTRIKLQRIDRQISFSWAANSNGSDSLRPVDGDFAAIWDGLLQARSDGDHKFRVVVDGQIQDSDYKYQLFVDEQQIDPENTIIPLKSSQPVKIWLSYQQINKSIPVNLRLEWSSNGQPYQTIGGEGFSTSQTIVANDVLARSREFIPELSASASSISAQIKNYRAAQDWRSEVRLGDFDGDGLVDLFLYGRDSMGQGIASVYANRSQALRVVDVDSNTVDPYKSQLLLPSHELEDGQEIRFEAPSSIGDQLPDGIEPSRPYIVRVVNANKVILYKSWADFSSGSKVQLNSNASGRIRYLSPTDRFSLAGDSDRMRNIDQSVHKNSLLLNLSGFDELVWASPIDIDQDGDLDLAALIRNIVSNEGYIEHANQMLGYRNDGKGSFTKVSFPQDLSALPTASEIRPLFADLDRDGRDDLIVAWDADTDSDEQSDSTLAQLWTSGGRPLLESTAGKEFSLEAAPFLGGVVSAVDLNKDGGQELLLAGEAIDSNAFTLSSQLTVSDRDGRTVPWAPIQTNGKLFELGQLLNWSQSSRIANARYRVSLTSPDFDSHLELLKKEQDQRLITLAMNDDVSQSRKGSELIVTDDGTSNYLLRVSTFSPSSTGKFTLNIERLNERVASYQWKNNELVKINGNSPQLTGAAVYAVAADVDLDGKEEILLGGAKGSQLASAEPTDLTLVPMRGPDLGDLPGGADSTAQWIDQDNDGDLDLFLTHRSEEGPGTRLFRNPAVGDPSLSKFQELGTLLPGLLNPSAAWADVDGDTDLDLVLSGAIGMNGDPFLQLFRNTTVDRNSNNNRTGSQNLPPSLNLGRLKAKWRTNDPATIRLSWTKIYSTGEEPYTTNLRLGTTSGGHEIISALARADGSRLVSQRGNMGLAMTRSVPLWGLGRGQRHFWSVQTIDNGFLSSPFSQEQSFVVSPMVTEDVAAPMDPDQGLDLPSLYAGETLTSPSNPNLSFTVPDGGISGPLESTLTGLTTVSEGDNLDLTFSGALLENRQLQLQVSGNGIDWEDFRGSADLMTTSTGIRFSYPLSNDWKTEGVENVTFKLVDTSGSSTDTTAMTLICAPLIVGITDSSLKPPLIQSSVLDLDGDGNQDWIRQVTFPSKTSLYFGRNRTLQVQGTGWEHQFLDLNMDWISDSNPQLEQTSLPDLLLVSPTTSKLYRGVKSNSNSPSGFVEVTDINSNTEGLQTLPPFKQAICVDATSDGRSDLWLATDSGLRLFVNGKTGLEEKDFLANTPGVNPLSSDGSILHLLGADVDGDGDNDLISGNGSSLRLFNYRLGSYFEAPFLANTQASLALGANIKHTQVLTGDIDNNGLLDLLLLHASEGLRLFSYSVGGFRSVDLDTVSSKQALLPPSGLYFTTATWFDADHDGRLDLAVGLSNGTIRMFHQQDGAFIFKEYINQPSQKLEGINRLESRDLDNDGDPDLLAFNSVGQQIQVDNDAAVTNSPPSWLPRFDNRQDVTENQFITMVNGQTVEFRWKPAFDDHTPALGLSYNLRVGTAPGLSDVLSLPLSKEDIPLFNPFNGNVGAGASAENYRSWTLKNLLAGTYYWSVQAVDGSGRASTFSAEQRVQVLPSLSIAQLASADLPEDPDIRDNQVRINLPFKLSDDVTFDVNEFQLTDGTSPQTPLMVSSVVVRADRRALLLELNRAVDRSNWLSFSWLPGSRTAGDLRDKTGNSLSAFSVKTKGRNLELLPVLSNAMSINEGDSGKKTVTVRIDSSFISKEPITLDYSVYSDRENGDNADTSSEAPDVLATSGQLVIPANESFGSFQFTVLGDTIPENNNGQFRIHLTNPQGALLPPGSEDLLVTLLQDPSDGAPPTFVDLKAEPVKSFRDPKAPMGGRKDLLWDIVNVGNASGGQPFNTEVWLSGDDVLDTSDLFLGRASGIVPAAQGRQRQRLEVDLPKDVPSGTHQLLFLTNPEGLLLRDSAPLAEKATTMGADPWANNLMRVPLLITTIDRPDLQFATPFPAGQTFIAGTTLTLNTRVRNDGAYSAGGWQVKAYLSRDTLLDDQDVLLQPASAATTAPLAGDQITSDLTLRYKLPSHFDGPNNIFMEIESPQGNKNPNRIEVPIMITGGKPIITVAGFADRKPPIISSTAIVQQGVAAGIRIQANELLQKGQGNHAENFQDLNVANQVLSDTLAPQLTNPIVDGTALTLVLSERLPESLMPDPSEFVVQTGPRSFISVDNIVLQGNRLLLKLRNAVQTHQEVTLTYTPNNLKRSLHDGRRNKLSSTGPLNVTNRTGVKDTNGPVASWALVDNQNVDGIETGQIRFIVSELLLPGLKLDPAEFTIRGGTKPLKVRSAKIDGAIVILTLSRRIGPRENLKLTYNAGTDGGDDLQDNAPIWASVYKNNPLTGVPLHVQDISSLDISHLRLMANELIVRPTDGSLDGQLLPGESYELTMPRGFVEDLAGNPQDPTTIRISTLPDNKEHSGTFVYMITSASITGTGSVHLPLHGLVTGSTLQVRNNPPSPLLDGLSNRIYYVKVLDSNSIELHRKKDFSGKVIPSGIGSALLEVVTPDSPEVLSPNLLLERAVRPGEEVLFNLKRQGMLDKPLTVNFTLTGSATVLDPMGDYKVLGNPTAVQNSNSWQAEFPIGAEQLLIHVIPKQDSIPEFNETITLTLDNSTNNSYQIPTEASSRSLTAYILDDDVPINDSFANALVLTGVNSISKVNNRNATSEVGEPRLGEHINQHTLWWRWEAPTKGSFILTTNGSEADTRMALLKAKSSIRPQGGNKFNLEMLEVNSHGGVDGGAQIHINAESGTTYYVMVDSENSQTGTVQLQIASNSLRVQGGEVKVIEDVNQDARISIQLTRGVSSSDLISVAYELESGTAEIGKDFGVSGQNQLTGRISFPVYAIPRSSYKLEFNKILLANHDLKSGDRISFASVDTQSSLPDALAEGPYYISVEGDSLELYRLPTLNSESRVRFSTMESLPEQMIVVERSISIPILGDRLLELDERFKFNLTGITSGQAFIESTSSVVLISDVLNFDSSGSLPADIEVGQLSELADGNSVLTGNIYRNQLFGNQHPNTLRGMDGSDLLIAGASDTLIGGTGNDRYLLPANLTPTTLPWIIEEERADIDIIISALSSTDINNYPNVENLEIISTNHSSGSGNSLNNNILGGSGNDQLDGRQGNDTLNGSMGWDTLRGGVGDDTYLLLDDGNLDKIEEALGEGIDSIKSRVSIDLANYQNIENVRLLDLPKIQRKGENVEVPEGGNTIDRDNNINATGTQLANTLTGNTGNNILEGLKGNDLLIGGDGNDLLSGGNGTDTLNGSSGNDTLRGGGGADIFCFVSSLRPNHNRDLLIDFNPASGDRIELSQKIFPAFTMKGTLPDSMFASGAAITPDPHLIYSPLTGSLSYDPNGNEPGKQKIFAVLPANLQSISASSFSVI